MDEPSPLQSFQLVRRPREGSHPTRLDSRRKVLNPGPELVATV